MSYPTMGPPRSKLYTCLGLSRYWNFRSTLKKTDEDRKAFKDTQRNDIFKHVITFHYDKRLKGIIHSKIKKRLSSFNNHSNVIPNPNDFLSSIKHKSRIFEQYPGHSVQNHKVKTGGDKLQKDKKYYKI